MTGMGFFATHGLRALCVALAVGVSACSDRTASGALPPDVRATSAVPQREARLDEAGLVAAVGSPIAYRHTLEDGHALQFRAKDSGPDFSLEFRNAKARLNVAWMRFRGEEGKYDDMNAENERWARNVLTYAVGQDGADQILERVRSDKPITGSAPLVILGHEVRASGSSSVQRLVTIYQ